MCAKISNMVFYYCTLFFLRALRYAIADIVV